MGAFSLIVVINLLNRFMAMSSSVSQTSSSSQRVSFKEEPGSSLVDLEDRLLSACKSAGDEGVQQMSIFELLPDSDAGKVLATVNKLLGKGFITLLQNEDGEIIYKYKDKSTLDSVSEEAKNLTREERLVAQIIDDSGNTGIWNRDIRTKSDLTIVQVNKIIKSLEGKQIIREVKGASGRKKMYIRSDRTRDVNQCSSPWVNMDGEAEVEFVRIILDHCELCLKERSEKAKEMYPNQSIMRHHASFVSIAEFVTLIKGLNVSKVDLKPQDVETLLDLLVYDCKAEKTVKGSVDLEQATSYKLVTPLLPPSGLVCTPCGACPVKNDCAPIGDITPIVCEYFNNSWLDSTN